MGIARMDKFIEIVQTVKVKDSDGFVTETDSVIADVRAYKEGRHGSTAWKNRASFSEATDLFRIRCIPSHTVDTSMVIICEGKRYEITSVENVKGRNMYTEILAKEVHPSG